MADYIPVPEPSSPAEMGSLSHDDLIRLNAQRQEAAARLTLINALMTTGRFSSALIFESDPDRQQWIKTLIAAEAEPDDSRCGCVATIDQADYTRNPNAAPILKPVPNYQRRFRYCSLKYQAMVNCYVCSVCGHAQTVAGPLDEAHEARERQRDEALEKELAKTPIRVYPKHRSEL